MVKDIIKFLNGQIVEDDIIVYWVLHFVNTQYYFVTLKKPVNISTRNNAWICQTVTFYKRSSGDFYINGAWGKPLSEPELAQILINTIDLLCESPSITAGVISIIGSAVPSNYADIVAFINAQAYAGQVQVAVRKEPRFYYWLHILRKVKSLLWR